MFTSYARFCFKFLLLALCLLGARLSRGQAAAPAFAQSECNELLHRYVGASGRVVNDTGLQQTERAKPAAYLRRLQAPTCAHAGRAGHLNGRRAARLLDERL